MINFSKELQDHLKKIGWKPNANIDIYNEYMDKYDYPDFVKEFMSEYGSLRITDLTKGLSPVTYIVDLDLFHSEKMDGIADTYSKILDEILYPIGVYKPLSYDIAVDRNGGVYILAEYCYCYGKNLYEGIESLVRCNNKFSLELDPSNPESKKWRSMDGFVDFDSYEFEYPFKQG